MVSARWLLWLVWLLCLGGCATAPLPALPPQRLFADALFQPPAQPVRAQEVLALSPSMREYLREVAARGRRAGTVQQGLIDALYKRGELKLEYDAAMTRNAAEAFEARTGNCLSLVLMTAAFAKALNIPVDYRSAYLEQTWSRRGTLYLRSGHVNITLTRRLVDADTKGVGELTIDFLPPEEIRGMRTRSISESTVIAMYLNNRAAEMLADGRIDEAYWLAREAIVQGPEFTSSYTTLAVVYQQHGDPALASSVLRDVLSREPENPTALANLAQMLERQGEADEARPLRERLARVDPRPAFHYYELGREALRNGDYRAARDFFAKEVARADYSDEFHYWLAVADFKLGDVDAARRELAKAMEVSTTQDGRALYAAKLAWIRTRLR